VDGSYLTVLFQNDVDGFELKTRGGGDFVRVRPAGPDSLLVVAGQPLVVSTLLVLQQCDNKHL
jgi:isopenicillin N synthase-like dioxygenase